MMLGETVLRTAIREHNADGTCYAPEGKGQSRRACTLKRIQHREDWGLTYRTRVG